MGLTTPVVPMGGAGESGWREMWQRTRQTGLTWLNRIAFWFSMLVVIATLSQMADADWTNFRRHLGYHLFVVGWLALVTYTVRTIGTRELSRFWLMGFFPVTFVAYLLTELTESQFGTRNLQTGGIVPIVEEVIKFLPLILWTTVLRPRHRHGTLSDFLVLGFMVGAGFSFHEDALYSRVAASGFDDGFLGSLFPIFLTTDQYTVTHAGWTALAAVGVGLISLHRQRPFALAGGIALVVVPIVDHAAVNWSGDGSDFMHSITRDGHLAAWLFVGAVVGTLMHDAGALRWATSRDRLFPAPTVTEDVRSLTRGGGPPERVADLVARQRYRRRRNATFIDLFSVRSRGVSAGHRHRVQAELKVARDTVGLRPTARSERGTVRRVQPASPGASPLELTPTRLDEAAQKRRRRAAGVAIALAAVIALLFWWSRGTDPDANDEVIGQLGGSDSGPTATNEPAAESAGEEPAGPSAAAGPIVTEAVLLRWQFFDESGPIFEQILAADGDRQLWVSRSTLYYQDGGVSIRCDFFGTDAINCFAEERTGSLVEFGMAGYPAKSDVPGIAIESGRIAGRDVTCVSFTENETSTRDCRDDESGLQLLLEQEGVTIVGGRRYSRTELVEWSAPSEADFAIPPEAQAVLNEG